MVAVNIRNAATERPATTLAKLTGETKTAAVTKASCARLARHEKGAYGQYSTDEHRRQTGGIGDQTWDVILARALGASCALGSAAVRTSRRRRTIHDRGTGTGCRPSPEGTLRREAVSLIATECLPAPGGAGCGTW